MVPQMDGAMQNYYQPMTFVTIGKIISGGFVVEEGDPVNFRGVMVPHKPTELQIKAQGQRKWVWWKLFCTPELKLLPDDVAVYLSDQYRCISVEPYDLYNFRVYVIIQDYSSTIANVVYDGDGKVVDDGNQDVQPEVVTE